MRGGYDRVEGSIGRSYDEIKGMKRLTLNLMTVSIQLEIAVLPILKLLKSVHTTR